MRRMAEVNRREGGRMSYLVAAAVGILLGRVLAWVNEILEPGDAE